MDPLPDPGLMTEEERAEVFWDLLARQEAWEASMESALAVRFEKQEEAILAGLDRLGPEWEQRAARWQAATRSRRRRLEEEATIASLFDAEVWVEEFRRLYADQIPAAMMELVEETIAELNLVGLVTISATDPVLLTFVAERSVRFATGVNETTRKRLKAALREVLEQGQGVQEFRRAVVRIFEEAKGARATMIARTEMQQARNHAQYQTAVRMAEALAGTGRRPKLMWISSRDDRVRDSHAAIDGRTVEVGGLFVVGACQMRHPLDGEMCGEAGEIVNCRCFLRIFVVAGEAPAQSGKVGAVGASPAVVAVSGALSQAGVSESA